MIRIAAERWSAFERLGGGGAAKESSSPDSLGIPMTLSGRETFRIVAWEHWKRQG